jgi:hypothetical protein
MTLATITTYFASTDTALDQQIASIDNSSQFAPADTTYTIDISTSFSLTAGITAIDLANGDKLVIQGTDGTGNPVQGSGNPEVQTLDGAGSYSGFFVYSGSVTIENLAIDDTLAQGGKGAAGGGGGAGLGGGLFIASAGNVTLQNVSFSGDEAKGGAGGAGQGDANFGGGGGGGGLNGGDGGASVTHAYATLGFEILGGGGGGIGTSGVGGAGGKNNGKAGIVPGAGPGNSGEAGGAGGVSGGGGGGGGTDGASGSAGSIWGGNGGNGGIDGNFGGGGGGAGGGLLAHTTGGGHGNFPGLAGAGGFGGGGGGGELGGVGGNGGFGGGAGYGGYGSVPGFGGDVQGYFGSGGGGLGAGGDIFVQVGGTLMIEGGSLSGGSVDPGAGGGFPGASAFGSGIFYGGTGSSTNGTGGPTGQIIFEPQAANTSGNPQIVSDNIADDFGSGSTTGADAVTLQVVVNGPGTLELSGTNSTYSGGTELESGTLLVGNAAALGSGPIIFDPNGDPTYAVTTGDLPGNPISTFTDPVNDHIDITNLPTSELSGHWTVGAGPIGGEETLHIGLTNGSTVALNFVTSATTSYSTGSFVFGPDAGDGTEIDPACFLEGTLIATARGEVAVETLAIGDRVMTKDGSAKPIKWIGHRIYDGRFAAGDTHLLPICIKAGALADGVPRRDLWLSPQHALYLDGVLIPAGALVNGASIVQARAMERIAYYHIELAAHDVLLAEGTPAESFVDDDSRGIFQNAHDYKKLYPEAARTAARYCAPRVEEGYALEAMQRRLARRAGVSLAGDATTGPMRGSLDLVSASFIEGWAQNESSPEAPVCLEILVGGEAIGQVIANRYRHDLKRVGIGSGYQAFAFASPPGLVLSPETVTVRRALDGAMLPTMLAMRKQQAAA